MWIPLEKGSHAAILDAFGNGEADILLGDANDCEGLGFSNVTLVGVLNADTSLNLPDYRSSERTFQLLTRWQEGPDEQRKKERLSFKATTPIIMRFDLPKTKIMKVFAYEMQIRRQLGYTPYYFTVGLTLSHKSEEIVDGEVTSGHGNSPIWLI